MKKELYDLIANKIERDPASLQIPLENIDRWLAAGQSAPHRLEEWRALILEAQRSPEGFATLLSLLRDQSEAALHLKSFGPFAGVLTTLERRAVILKCAFAH
jgi:hypothetical protein